MTRPMTGAPLERVHRTRRGRAVVRALLAGLALVAVGLGLPGALLVIAGNPVPGSTGGLVGGSEAVRITVKSLCCLAWLAWAQFVACLVVESVAGVRGTGLARRVPFAVAAQQDLARRLVTAVLLFTDRQGLHSAPPPEFRAAPGGPPGSAPPPGLARGPVPAGTPAGGPGEASDVAGAGLLAAGLVDVLGAVRARTARTRRPGAGVLLPDAAAAGVEVAARLGADRAGARQVELALRALATGLGSRHAAVPEFYAARLSADRFDLLLVERDTAAPAPFVVEDSGARWSLPRDTALPPAGSAPAALPALVSVGTDPAGARVLVDLESVGGVVSVGGDLDVARSLVAAAAVELATSGWSDTARITAVGFGAGVDLVGQGRVRCVDTLGQVAAEVTGRLAASRRALSAAGIDSVLTGRVRQFAGEDCTPDLLLLAGPPAPAELAALAEYARACRRAPVGILVAGPVPGARLAFSVDAGGVLRAGPLGALAAQRLTARSYAALVRLAQASATVLPGPQPDAGQSGRPESQAPAGPPGEAAGSVQQALSTPAGPVAPQLPHPVDPDAPVGVLLRILGEPGAEGPTLASPGSPLAVEICLYLAVHGAARIGDLVAAIWPGGVGGADRDRALGQVRDWLGAGPDRLPRLRFGVGGTDVVSLSGDVRVDWHLFVALARRGTTDDLRRALDLVRGPLAQSHPSGRYAWLAAEPITYQAGPHVVDVAHRCWRSCLDGGDPDAAVAAVRAGLRAEPVSEALWADLAVAVRARDTGDTGTSGDVGGDSGDTGEPGDGTPDPPGARRRR